MNRKVIFAGIVLATAAIAAVGFFGLKSRQQGDAGGARGAAGQNQSADQTAGTGQGAPGFPQTHPSPPLPSP